MPPGAVWSLPAYELALMLATHCEQGGLDDVRIALVTPEDEPLVLFGPDASAALRVLLEEHRIALHTGFFAADLRGGALTLLPSGTIAAFRDRPGMNFRADRRRMLNHAARDQLLKISGK